MEKYHCTYCGEIFNDREHLEDCKDYKIHNLQADNKQQADRIAELEGALERIQNIIAEDTTNKTNWLAKSILILKELEALTNQQGEK